MKDARGQSRPENKSGLRYFNHAMRLPWDRIILAVLCP